MSGRRIRHAHRSMGRGARSVVLGKVLTAGFAGVVVAVASAVPATATPPQQSGADPTASTTTPATPPTAGSGTGRSGRGRGVLGAPAGQILARSAGSPAVTAQRFAVTNGPSFGAPAGSDLRVTAQTADRAGRSAVRLQQFVEGVPVLGAEVAVQLDAAGNVTSSLGHASDRRPGGLQPTIDAGAAAVAAEAILRAEHPSDGPFRATAPSLEVFDPALLDWPGDQTVRLVWRLSGSSVENAKVSRLFLVDASTGSVVVHFSETESARDRDVCDMANQRLGTTPCTDPERSEGQPPSGNNDIDKAYDYAGDVYDFFLTRFGRDSLDGAGLSLTSTVRYCATQASQPCPEQNSFWAGGLKQMFYGEGESNADDVVGHELNHGFIQFTADLFYYYQSGAINESMADVFGELIDLTNHKGNDTPAVRWSLFEDQTVGAVRNMANPPLYNQPDRIGSPQYYVLPTDNGGVHYNSGVGNKAAALIVDGGSFNGHTIRGLGIDKGALLYYTVMTEFLTSGSDYADLAFALTQSCTNLVGTDGITESDCGQVGEATAATQMTMSPVGAPRPDPPLCDASTTEPTTQFFDDMENPQSGNWALSAPDFAYLGPPDGSYATSGVRSLAASGDQDVDATATRTAPVVPAVGSRTFLHFRHAENLAVDADGDPVAGGVVEYSTDGGGSWNDAGPLFTDAGYNGTIDAPANALDGRRALVGLSHGYTGSRVELTSLAGQSVRLRFRYAAVPGAPMAALEPLWVIDDVRVYTCASPATGYYPTAPARLLDTRSGIGTAPGPLSAGGRIDLDVTGRGGISASNLSAVVLNLTAIAPTADTHITVWPSDQDRPPTSNMNVAAGETRANLITVPVGANGTISLATNKGGVHLAADVIGYYDDGQPGGGRFNPLTPTRLADTRTGSTPLGPGERREFKLVDPDPGPEFAGSASPQDAVPDQASAVLVNVTAVQPSAATHLTAFPAVYSSTPIVSTVNLPAGDTRANLAIIATGGNGRVAVVNNAGTTNVVIDILGWFDVGGTVGSPFHSSRPSRILDTRNGTGAPAARVGPGEVLDVSASGVGGVPPTGAAAVLVNVTAVSPTADTHETAFPTGAALPVTSNVNVTRGSTAANLVAVPLGADGKISIRNNAGDVDLVGDVVGWYG